MTVYQKYIYFQYKHRGLGQMKEKLILVMELWTEL